MSTLTADGNVAKVDNVSLQTSTCECDKNIEKQASKQKEIPLQNKTLHIYNLANVHRILYIHSSAVDIFYPTV